MFITSCFENYKGDNGVSIAGYAPEWYSGNQFRKFAPKRWFYDIYANTAHARKDSDYQGEKREKNENFYIENFIDLVLDDFRYTEFKNKFGENAVALCHEPFEEAKTFCHRGIWSEYARLIHHEEVYELYDGVLIPNAWAHLRIEKYLPRILSKIKNIE